MKKRFYSLAASVILMLALCAGVLALSDSGKDDQAQKKEKVQIVVVKKKERDKSSGESDTRKPRDESRQERSNQ